MTLRKHLFVYWKASLCLVTSIYVVSTFSNLWRNSCSSGNEYSPQKRLLTKYNLTDEDVAILVFTNSDTPQFADLNVDGNLRDDCQLDFNCIFEQGHDSFENIDNYTGVIVRGYKYFSPILKNDIGCGKFKRDPNQIWITTHSEAALNTVQMNHLKTAQVMRSAFNWSMSFSTRSTIYRPWFFVREKKQPSQTFLDVKNGIENMNKSKDFCWLVSNCHHDWAKRREFANKLIPLLPSKLHIWGSGYEDCLDRQSKNNAINHGKFSGHYNELYEPQQKRMKECKFYLAFDNAICSDFVTEKFSNSLEAGAIPIVNGWRDSYEQRVPVSFIHVADFRTVSDLANHLQYLLSDENAFMEYHKWRLNYEIERLHLQAVCDVCRKLKDFKKNPKPSLIPDLSTMHDSLQECQKT